MACHRDGITTASSRGTACLILGDPQLFDKYKKWPGDRVSSSRVSATRLNFWKRIDLDVSRGCSFFEEREGGREEEEKKKIDWSVGRRGEGSISRGLDTRESNIAGGNGFDDVGVDDRFPRGFRNNADGNR